MQRHLPLCCLGLQQAHPIGLDADNDMASSNSHNKQKAKYAIARWYRRVSPVMVYSLMLA